LNVAELVTELRDRWHAPFAARGRRLNLTAVPHLPDLPVSAAAVRQILEVLLDNALVHGSGTASVTMMDTASGVRIEVGDEGSGLQDPERAFARRADRSGHGIGLALARSLAEAEGGRLVLRRAGPAPVFSLLLPTDPDDGSDNRRL
jgi:signal transduction histidine kinase